MCWQSAGPFIRYVLYEHVLQFVFLSPSPLPSHKRAAWRRVIIRCSRNVWMAMGDSRIFFLMGGNWQLMLYSFFWWYVVCMLSSLLGSWIVWLFCNAFSVAYSLLGGWFVCDELGRLWQQEFVSCLKVLYQHLRGDSSTELLRDTVFWA
jgi:hypothetical protein